MTWAEFLAAHRQGGLELFSPAFLERWGGEPWAPTADDRKAAGQLHNELVSRVSTQRLGYLHGVEKAALDSVYRLFQKTRDIADKLPGCRHFDALAWEVLNAHVRPFTAKWHRESERGTLRALDASDEFRGQLAALQPLLRRFDEVLVHLRDGRPAPPSSPHTADTDRIDAEMRRELAWGIPAQAGGMTPADAGAVNDAERQAIRARRDHYRLGAKPHAVGLALSGGGIRSATFSLGVLVALARRNLLPQVDYLSTVSGGGYLGSFLSAFLQSPGSDVGLGRDQLPFRREEGEAEALRHIRHQSRYLAAGSLWHRIKAVLAQLYGMAVNLVAIAWVLTCLAVVEHALRSLPSAGVMRSATFLAAGALGLGAVAALVALRFRGRFQQRADALVAVPALALLALLGLRGLTAAHEWYAAAWAGTWTWSGLVGGKETWAAALGALPFLTSALAGVLGRVARRLSVVLVVLSALAAPLFLFGLYLVIYDTTGRARALVPGTAVPVLWAATVLGALLYLLVLDINVTSPHRYYRNRLASAYLLRRLPEGDETGASIRLSSLGTPEPRAPYHLLNCALNVPASANPAMQGRRTDFFLFSPRFCGSPLIGYQPTLCWEAADPHLDLGTAMAVSGAAAAPQMGLATVSRLSFWLALLNVRLGYWARRPGRRGRLGAPGLWHLVKEMVGRMDERSAWLNLSDGGHIENLGVYELLRRRCKYIVAVDGEEDPRMTFHALTTLQRLAAIDLGVQIDVDLDDLRLDDQGLSRSHFRFCRIRYPKDDALGYLLYLKLSLTGNEGEFLRRYRLDEPLFPHHSTADQFFSESQFEAYRSLGEHVGEKLFLRALVGDLADSTAVEVEEWFRELGKRLLEPR